MNHERQTSSSTIAVVVLVTVILLGLVTVAVCGFAGILYLRIGRVQQIVPPPPPQVEIPEQAPPPQEAVEPENSESEGKPAEGTEKAEREEPIET